MLLCLLGFFLGFGGPNSRTYVRTANALSTESWPKPGSGDLRFLKPFSRC